MLAGAPWRSAVFGSVPTLGAVLTSTMDAARGILGYSHLHRLNALTMELIRPADMFLFDAFSDVSLFPEFETFAHRFPSAKFVMDTHPVESWEVSARSHLARQAGVGRPGEPIDSQLATKFRGTKGWIEASLYSHRVDWGVAYHALEERVADFFSGVRSGDMLRFDAMSGEGWEALRRFRDRPVPDGPYPHTNSGRSVGPANRTTTPTSSRE